MIFLTATDQGRQRLRDSAVLLHCLIVISILSGFVVISLIPAIYPSRPRLRLFSLGFSTFSGMLSLVAACQLGATKGLLQKLDKVQEEIEISRLAAEQYLQSERASAEAEAALNPPAAPAYLLTTPPFSGAVEPNQEVSKQISKEPEAEGDGIKSAMAVVVAVQKAKAEGLSDSKIIQEVLGYRGAQYNKGKMLLNQICGETSNENQAERNSR